MSSSTTTDSNTWGGASGYTYTFSVPDGTTDVDASWSARARTPRARLLALVLGTVGKSVLVKAFNNSVKAIEARVQGAPAQ